MRIFLKHLPIAFHTAAMVTPRFGAACPASNRRLALALSTSPDA
ncbi:hypothetical protein [Methylococcus sp. EFPC2]|nr:hypothetical protein [Methylococcus sp. EFPC2]